MATPCQALHDTDKCKTRVARSPSVDRGRQLPDRPRERLCTPDVNRVRTRGRCKRIPPVHRLVRNVFLPSQSGACPRVTSLTLRAITPKCDWACRSQGVPRVDQSPPDDSPDSQPHSAFVRLIPRAKVAEDTIRSDSSLTIAGRACPHCGVLPPAFCTAGPGFGRGQ